ERPLDVLTDVARFIGVDPAFDHDLSLRLNVAGVPRRPWLHRLLRRTDRLKWAVNVVAPAGLRRRALGWQNRNLARPQVPVGVRRELMDAYRDDLALLEATTGLDVSRWWEEEAGHP